MDFTMMAEGLAFPEGPVVLPDGSIVVMEVFSGTVRRIWGQGRSEVVAAPGGGPNGAQLGPDGALYICNNGGSDWVKRCSLDGPEGIGRIERIDLESGKVERLYDHVGDRPLRAPNDLVFDAGGNLWFTDMGKTVPGAIETSAICRCRPDGSAISAPFRGGISYNGIGLSPDQRYLYVAETLSARLWRFGIDDDGALTQEPEWIGTAPGDTRFDSLAVTASGSICVGTLKTGGITTISSAGEVSFLPLPDRMVTNLAFGGEDMRTAYACFAGAGQLVAMSWPEPGLPLAFGYQPATGATSSTTSNTRPSGS